MAVAAGEVILAADHAPLYVGESLRTTSSAGVTSGTELLIQSYTFSAVAGARYKVTACQYAESTVALDNFPIKTRWATGPTVTSVNTSIVSANPASAVANKGVEVVLVGTFVATTTGQVTVGVFLRRAAGSGTVTSVGGGEQINTILVERYQ